MGLDEVALFSPTEVDIVALCILKLFLKEIMANCTNDSFAVGKFISTCRCVSNCDPAFHSVSKCILH